MFHLSQARHNVEEEASRSGTCIDRVGQAFELDALPLKFADKIHEVLYAAPEPVQFPDDEGISFAESFLSFGQTWPAWGEESAPQRGAQRIMGKRAWVRRAGVF